MKPLFSRKCQACGFDNHRDAKFCEKCGQPLAAGIRTCGVCGTENKNDAVYCKNCGRPIDANAEVELHGYHWVRREGDFAAKLDIADLPGIFSKKLEIEPGTQAMIITSGKPQETLQPGVYSVDNIGKSISSWLQGIPRSATILLVDDSPNEIIMAVSNRYTSDPLPISLSLRMLVEVEHAEKFMLNVLRNRKRYALDDLKQYIAPEVEAATDMYLRQHTLQQLVENASTQYEIELAVEEALRTTFEQYGLKLVFMRTVELDLEAYDKIKGIKGKYSLLVEEGQAEVSGQQSLLELQKKVDLHELAQETAKVENEERKVAIYKRMRQTVLSDKMDDVRSEADFNQFMDEIDRQKLLSEKERQDLLKGWKDEAEDHERARAFLLAKAEVEEKYQLRAIGIKSDAELELKEQEYKLELERKRADLSLQIEEQKWRAALAERTEIYKQDFSEAQDAVDLLLKLKRGKMVLELEKARADVDLEIMQMAEKHKLELERLDKLAGMGTEALIAASPAEQGKILQDLKRVEIFKSMSEEQILALAAEKSPEISKVFEAKYRSIAEGQAGERERELYEKLIAENKSSQQLLIETQKAAMDRLQHMSEHDVDAIKEISQAYARHGSTPVILRPDGQNEIISAASGTKEMPANTKTCQECGRQVAVNARFCPYCSHAFKDVD